MKAIDNKVNLKVIRSIEYKTSMVKPIEIITRIEPIKKTGIDLMKSSKSLTLSLPYKSYSSL